MKDFGFTVTKDRQIDFDQNDQRLLIFVLENEPSFRICISCGGCTATCSAGNLIDFNIRRLNMLIRRGETGDLEREINKCMLCGKCILVCPRGINTRNVILKIKEAIQIFK
jgi:heterodisulfide reductase subunit C